MKEFERQLRFEDNNSYPIPQGTNKSNILEKKMIVYIYIFYVFYDNLESAANGIGAIVDSTEG